MPKYIHGGLKFGYQGQRGDGQTQISIQKRNHKKLSQEDGQELSGCLFETDKDGH